MPQRSERPSAKVIATAIAFGSEQGFVGQFNDTLANFVLTKLNELPGKKIIWAVGERIYARLEDAGTQQNRLYYVPNSVTAITPLVSQMLVDHEDRPEKGETYLFHNRSVSGTGYEPVKQRLLPLDTEMPKHNIRRKTWSVLKYRAPLSMPASSTS